MCGCVSVCCTHTHVTHRVNVDSFNQVAPSHCYLLKELKKSSFSGACDEHPQVIRNPTVPYKIIVIWIRGHPAWMSWERAGTNTVEKGNSGMKTAVVGGSGVGEGGRGIQVNQELLSGEDCPGPDWRLTLINRYSILLFNKCSIQKVFCNI